MRQLREQNASLESSIKKAHAPNAVSTGVVTPDHGLRSCKTLKRRFAGVDKSQPN